MSSNRSKRKASRETLDGEKNKAAHISEVEGPHAPVSNVGPEENAVLDIFHQWS
jgi:hypothetical protein